MSAVFILLFWTPMTLPVFILAPSCPAATDQFSIFLELPCTIAKYLYDVMYGGELPTTEVSLAVLPSAN